MHRALAWLYGRPYLLLTLTMLMWGGNAVASRLAVGEVSPMTLTFLRWTLPVALLGVALHQQLLVHRQALAERWPLVLLMGTLGLTVFNALMYVAAHHTTAVNITILQGSMPVFVLVGALIFYGTRIQGRQMIGMAVTLLGALRSRRGLIFGALLAVLILDEPFAAYHAVGLALVLGGIWLAEPKER